MATWGVDIANCTCTSVVHTHNSARKLCIMWMMWQSKAPQLRHDVGVRKCHDKDKSGAWYSGKGVRGVESAIVHVLM